MKSKFKYLFIVVTLVTTGILVNNLSSNDISNLLLDNVEALANSEWGGGGSSGEGGYQWYEYHRVSYEYRKAYHPGIGAYIPMLCEVMTCHGAGTYWCNGYINCF